MPARRWNGASRKNSTGSLAATATATSGGPDISNTIENLETFAALGHGEQMLMVIPAMDLVVAVNTHAWNSEEDEINQVYALISEFILPALPDAGN